MYRKLKVDDYNEYLNLLSQLANVGNVTLESFTNFVNSLNDNHQVWVFTVDNKIVASGTLVKEQKLIHSMCKFARIEDVVVDKFSRHSGLGLKLVNRLVELSKDCYRVSLSCKPELVGFYAKNGFVEKPVQMSIQHVLD
jgi:glucosamine-phosphate N-acetyltransferase